MLMRTATRPARTATTPMRPSILVRKNSAMASTTTATRRLTKTCCRARSQTAMVMASVISRQQQKFGGFQ